MPDTKQLDAKSKKIRKILRRLFDKDKINEGFYDAIIRRMKEFTDDPETWVPELLDIWKGVKRDVENGMNGEYREVREYIRQNFIRLLKKRYSKGIAKLNAVSGDYAFSIDSLERMDSDAYTTYIGFLVMGCPNSTDIDVAVFCPESANRDGGVATLFTSELNRLYQELTELGYNVKDREIDINQVIVINRQIVASTKGGKETANIMLATYCHHVQQTVAETGEVRSLQTHPLDPVELTDEDFESKVRSFAKYCWDYLKYLVDKKTYQRMRDTRVEVYEMGTRAVMTELHRIMDMIVTDPEVAKRSGLDMAHWRSAFKSLTMKTVQIIVYYHEGTMSYTKAEIAEDAAKIADHYDGFDGDVLRAGCLYNLTRGKSGRFVRGLFDHLVKCYQQIVKEILDDEAIKTGFSCEREYLMDLDIQGGEYPGGCRAI
jgi:hypothetical protein